MYGVPTSPEALNDITATTIADLKVIRKFCSYNIFVEYKKWLLYEITVISKSLTGILVLVLKVVSA